MMINQQSEPSNIFNYYGNEMYDAMLKILDKIILSNANHIVDASNKSEIGKNSEPNSDHKLVHELKQSQNIIRKPMMKLNLNVADGSTISKKQNLENSSYDQSAHFNVAHTPEISYSCVNKRLKADELSIDTENIPGNYVEATDKSNNDKPWEKKINSKSNKQKTNKPPAVYLNRVRPRFKNFQTVSIKQEKLEPVKPIETEISTKIIEQNNTINNTHDVTILKNVMPSVDSITSYKTPVKIENYATIFDNQQTISVDISSLSSSSSSSSTTTTTSVILKDTCEKLEDHKCRDESSSLNTCEKSNQKLNETNTVINGKVLRVRIDKIPLQSTTRRTRSSYYDKTKAHSSIPGYEKAIKSDKMNGGRKKSNLNNSKETDKSEMKKIIPVEKYIKSENIVTSNCMPSYEEKVKIVEMAQKNPTWTLEMLRENSGFKKVFYRTHINKWADELKYGGSCREKLKAIDHYVIKKCIEYQKKKVKISNHHIREWGFEAMSQMNADNINFMAGKSWLGRFKKRYNITGSYTDLKIDYKLCKNTETSFSKIIEPKVNIVKLERKNSIRKPKTTKKTRKQNLENKKTDRLKIEVKQEEPQEEDESKEDNNWVYNKCIEYKKNIKGITNILFKKWQRDDEIEMKTNDKSQVNARSWTSWFNGLK